MTLNNRSLKILLCSMVLGCSVQAQLFVGNGGLVYISPGEQLYINGDLDVASGATVIHNATADIIITGTANLDGVMQYSAVGNQHILPYNHQQLYIGGSGNKIMDASLSVAATLQLSGTAKLITGNYVLALTGGSSSITGAAPFGSAGGSWIVTGNGSAGAANTGLGGLKIAGIGATGRSSAILFPVGPSVSTYHPLTVTNTGTDDDFTVSVNDQPVPGAPVNETVQATWHIEEAAVGGSNVTLGTQWDAATEAISFVRASCGVVHSNGTVINAHGEVGVAAGTGPYTKTGSGFTSFSPFGVTSNAVVLPVNFLHVKGGRNGPAIKVDWDVATQNGISYYEVQKSSTGNNFIAAAQVATAAGNKYSWTDGHPNTGANFYRIRSVDLNGTSKYSGVVQVAYETKHAGIIVYPNPVVNSRMVLGFSNQLPGNYTIRVIGMLGKTVYQKQVAHNGADGLYKLQLPATLARGIYQITIDEPGGASTQLRLVLQ